jgi:erythromycin esterase
VEGTIKQPGGALVKFRQEVQAHDTWAKTGAEWRLRRSSTAHSKTWVDGNLVAELAAKAPMQPALRQAIAGELRARAIPFTTVMPGAGFADLAALDRVVGDARIVALGEASHGTAEFFRMKHRLFEYLVEKKGFTVFAFEANWPVVEIADRYVKTGEGSAAAALREIGFWVWATEEVRELIEWMRAYNAVPGRAKLLSFTGFDMQSPGAAAKCVIDAFDRLGAPQAETFKRLYDGTGDMYLRMDPLSLDPSKAMPDAEKARLRANVAEALKLVDRSREALLRTMTPAEYARVRQCAAVVVQGSLPGAVKGPDMFNARDEAMAANVKWLAEEAFPGEKIALWAHNAHIAGMSFAPGQVKVMGEYLRQTFGEGIRVLGFTFDRGDVRAVRMKQGKIDGPPTAMKVPTAKAGSVEDVLLTVGLPRFVLDLRGVAPAGKLGTWLNAPQVMRLVEAVYDPDNAAAAYTTVVLPKAFDALIYIEDTTASVPLQ